VVEHHEIGHGGIMPPPKGKRPLMNSGLLHSISYRF
jgi:hypothetical protein